jgi:hypothetical protein
LASGRSTGVSTSGLLELLHPASATDPMAAAIKIRNFIHRSVLSIRNMQAFVIMCNNCNQNLLHADDERATIFIGNEKFVFRKNRKAMRDWPRRRRANQLNTL